MISARQFALAASATAMLAFTAAQADARPAQPPIVDTSAKRWLEGMPGATRKLEHVNGSRAAIKHHHHRMRPPYKHKRGADTSDAAPPLAPS